MIKRIFTWIGGVVNIILILALILYPIIVKDQGPISFYWNALTELWVMVREPGVLSKIINVFN